MQEFSWGENELAARKEDRLSSLQCEMLRSEPMFCFETSLKVCAWTHWQLHTSYSILLAPLNWFLCLGVNPVLSDPVLYVLGGRCLIRS